MIFVSTDHGLVTAAVLCAERVVCPSTRAGDGSRDRLSNRRLELSYHFLKDFIDRNQLLDAQVLRPVISEFRIYRTTSLRSSVASWAAKLGLAAIAVVRVLKLTPCGALV